MSIIKRAIKLGNSAGVILPKKLLGCDVKITVVKKPLNIKKEVLSLLNENLPEILGIYITNKKPMEILAISTNLRDTIIKPKIKINVVPIKIIKKDIKLKPNLRKKLLKAETILNRLLILELRKEIKTSKISAS